MGLIWQLLYGLDYDGISMGAFACGLVMAFGDVVVDLLHVSGYGVSLSGGVISC